MRKSKLLPKLFNRWIALAATIGMSLSAYAGPSAPSCSSAHPDQMSLTPQQFAAVRRSYEELAPVEITKRDPTVKKLQALLEFMQLMRHTTSMPDIHSENEVNAIFAKTAYDGLIHHQIVDCGTLDKSFIALAKAFGIRGIRAMHITTLQTYHDYCPAKGQPRRPPYTTIMTHMIAVIPQGGNKWLIVDPDMAKQVPFISDFTDFMGQITIDDITKLKGKVIDLPGYDSGIFQIFTGIDASGGLLVNAVGTDDQDSFCIFSLEDDLNMIASGDVNSPICSMTPDQHVNLRPVDQATWGFSNTAASDQLASPTCSLTRNVGVNAGPANSAMRGF